ncbi:alpha/beta hydrolase [Subtercola sp. PAMC28395]|uniref:esterase/lipase family protein n=1 Tax=Subtercola sp. PAMC28395 TaxID=2846775 RepID=UPI001C0B9D53|nr:alpha/beta fold hydrolase [Subtercola sp. PAMC28395]QWT23757.1 alpha/beta hydrolase [Subtercola sp. PAMC28395]
MRRAAKAGFWMLDYAYDVCDEFRGLFRSPTTFETVADVKASESLNQPEGPNQLAVPNPSEGIRPIVLVPGVFEKWHALYGVALGLKSAGHPVYFVPQLGRNTDPIAETASRVAQLLDEKNLRDVVIVAHSKGGLIGKYLMMRCDPQHRVAGLVAINTPFSGSVWGRLVRIPSIREFDPADLTVTFLAGEADVNSRIVSIFGSFDQNVPEGSELAGAKNIQLPVAGHSRILSTAILRRTVVDEVTSLPSQDVPQPRG